MRCRAVMVMMAMAVMIPLIADSQTPPEKGIDPSLYLTPISIYSRIGKSLAIRYQPELIAMIDRIQREIGSDRFQIMDLDQSPNGGVGFWVNPDVMAPDHRFLGIAARVNIQLPYFPDSGAGRVCDTLDAFGKDLFVILQDTLDRIPDNSVQGVAVVLIYSKSRLDDPNFMEKAEISMMFINRDDLKKYNGHQFTLQTLFNRTDFYYFQTRDQIRFFFDHFLRG